MTDQLREKLKTLPRLPGVYFHKSESGEIIYVGKAAILKNRVRQYFQDSRLRDVKTDALVAEIVDTDWIEVETELDALFLESEMVKRHMPRYNILLRDDKSQLYVRIPMNEAYPPITFTRAPLDDGATYFGPYFNGFAVKKALRYLRRAFPYSIHETMPKRLCLQAHIGLCPGVEEQKISSREYKETLKKLIRYLKGERKSLMREIENEMKVAANEKRFEDAATLRNRLNDLKELQRRIIFGDRETIDLSKDKGLADLAHLLGLSTIPKRIEGYDISHVGGTNVVASMVVFTNGASERASYRKFKMSHERNDDVANMRETLTRRLSEKNLASWGRPDLLLIDGGKGQLSAVLDVLDEKKLLIPVIGIAKREEEMIVSKNRSHIEPAKLNELMRSVRPGVYVREEGDYYIVNLHVGQRNASPHSKNLRGGDTVSPYSDITKLFQRIRDEAHRFAVSYHSTLKRNSATKSILDDIPGVGPATRKKLIGSFGSGQGVKLASREQIAAVIGEKLAAKVHGWFHNEA